MGAIPKPHADKHQMQLCFRKTLRYSGLAFVNSSLAFLPLVALYALMICFSAMFGKSGSVLSDTWTILSNNCAGFLVFINSRRVALTPNDELTHGGREASDCKLKP